MAAITLTAVPADSLGSYSPTIQAEAAEPVYIVENLQTELGMSISLDELAANGNDADISDRKNATKGFLEKYDKSIIFDQETNKFYYASGSRTASSTTTFRTVGYELTFKLGGTTYKVDVLRKPDEDKHSDIISGRYDLEVVTEAENDGMTYNLFSVSMDNMNKVFEKRDLDFSSLFYSSRSSLTMNANAYLVKCQNEIQQAWLNADEKGNAVAGGTASALAHTPSEAAAFNMGISTENYFNKIMKLKPNAYNVDTEKVKLTDGSTAGAYYPEKSTSQSYYYINGNKNDSNIFHVRFTGSSKKSKKAAEVDEDNDFDLVHGRFDITTKENLAGINQVLNADTSENGIASGMIQSNTDYADGTFAITAPVEDSKKAIENSGGTYTTTATLLKSAKNYSIRPYADGTYTSKLDLKAAFKVNNMANGSIIAITPFVKAVKDATQPYKSGISSGRYEENKALYLIADKEAPKRADDKIEVVTVGGADWYRFKVTDSLSGVAKAAYNNEYLPILDGNNAADSHGIKRNTSAYVYVAKGAVTPGQKIQVALADNVGNISNVEVTIPQNYKNVTLTYSLSSVGLGYIDVSTTQTIVSGGSATFTVAVWPENCPTQGFLFKGWTKTKGGTTVEYTPGNTISINKDTTLYPIFVPAVPITLTYDMSGTGFSNMQDTQYVWQGNTATFGIRQAPLAVGAKFTGWKKAGETTPSLKYGDSYTIAKDAVLYPNYEACNVKVTYLVKQGNGYAVFDEQPVPIYGNHNLYSQGLVGNVSWQLFNGSFTSGGKAYSQNQNFGSQDVFQPGTTIQPYTDVVFIAVFANGLTYWDRGERLGEQIEITTNAKSTFTTFAAPHRKYWNFKGWKIRENSVVIGASVSQDCIGFFNLDAQWEANTYKVVFHSNAPGGCSTKSLGSINGQTGFDKEIEKDVQFTGDGSVGCDINLPGYKFCGWHGSADGGQNFGNELNYSADGIEHNIEPNAEGKIHLYARWEAIDITINFDLNKPDTWNHYHASSDIPYFTSGQSSVNVKFDSKINVPTAQLKGWHEAAYGSTVMSNWYRNPYRWDTGNRLGNNETVGYELLGNPDSLSGNNDNGRNVTFYAQWDPNAYTIYYVSNAPAGASTTDPSIWGWSQEPQQLIYDTPAYLNGLDLNTPSQGHNTDVLPGYTWVTWQHENGETYANSALVCNLTPDQNGSVYLYAQWKPNTYTVYYHANKPTKENNTHAASESPVISYNGQTSNDKIAVNVVWDKQMKGNVPTAALTGWHARYDADGVTDAWYLGNHYAAPGNRVSGEGTFNYATVGYPGNKNAYAQWQANWYYIRYHANGQGSVISGSIQDEKTMKAQVNTYKKYMTEYAYTNTFEKCIQNDMRNSQNTRIHIYDLEGETAESKFIRYDEGVAGEQKEHYSNDEKMQLAEYNNKSYEEYGLPDVNVSYWKHNLTCKTKFDYDFMGWDVGEAHADHVSHQWTYSAKTIIKNLTNIHRGSIDMYAFWNAFPNYDAVKDTTHFSVYEGADITMQMLKSKVQVWDKEQGCLTEDTDMVKIEEIVYQDGTKVTSPDEDYMLDTSTENIGEYSVTFSVTDNRGSKTYLTASGNIILNHEPVLEDIDNRFFYLTDIKELTAEEVHELLMRPIIRTDVEDDAYQAQEFLQQDDLFSGNVEPYTGFGQANWYQGNSLLNKVYEFTEEQQLEGLKILHEDMRTLTQREADKGKTFTYVCYTNDMFKKQMNKNGSMTIVDTNNDDVIPENATRRRVRFISSEYLDTLPEDWKSNDKREMLEESLERRGMISNIHT